jgi:hypothetical protein
MDETASGDDVAIKQVILTSRDDGHHDDEDETAVNVITGRNVSSDSACGVRVLANIQNHYMIQIVDNSPYPNEERKFLSSVTARLCQEKASWIQRSGVFYYNGHT